MNDPHHLQRFVAAQEPVYSNVLAELRTAHKTSHWMWFVFPQIQGLGRSWMAQQYAIHSLDEARAYLAHEVLGPRLGECTRLMLAVNGRSANEILGSPDDLKFRSSMTLFAQAAGDPQSPFEEALTRFFEGEADTLTIERLTEAK
jgi:uncharacterized protein (DUF1810 family)